MALTTSVPRAKGKTKTAPVVPTVVRTFKRTTLSKSMITLSQKDVVNVLAEKYGFDPANTHINFMDRRGVCLSDEVDQIELTEEILAEEEGKPDLPRAPDQKSDHHDPDDEEEWEDEDDS